MLSKTDYDLRFGQMTGNAEAANLAYGLYEINEAARYYSTKNNGNWWFLEAVNTQSTVASQADYVLPQAVRKIVDLYISVGSNIYSPEPIENPDLWKTVLQGQLGTGDRTMFYYRIGSSVSLQPIPSSAGNTITTRYRQNVINISADDYTTGTVTATLASAAIVGVGTTFSAAMVGRYIQLTSGDQQWYQIGAFTDTTHISLIAPYAGATTAGSAFTIKQTTVLPESYQQLPLLRAVARFYEKNKDLQTAKMFFDDAEDLYNNMVDESREKVEGAYLPPIGKMLFRDPNIPEPDIPTSSFT